MKYIAGNLFRKVVQHALTEGMRESDFDDLPTSIKSMDQLKAVPADHFFQLHEKVDHFLGPGFSVRVGQQMKMEDYGVLGLSWKTCSWAGEIFDRSERYFNLLSNTYVFRVKNQEDISYIYLERHPYRRGVALSNEATFSATVVVLRAITQSNMAPVAVSFQHQSPAHLKSYLPVFQCPLSFQQAHNFIAYRSADLDRRTIRADESINRFLVERVEEETRGIEISAVQVARDVEMLIKDALPSGIPSIGQVGRHMGMSSRTLNRRLSENGFTFRELVKKTQHDIAEEMLGNSSHSIGEIAFKTGFSEQSAFNRAFKRWTGQSPLEFRNSLS
jgi:AraC-like DNA-binding protein